jgi:hypothetical protein
LDNLCILSDRCSEPARPRSTNSTLNPPIEAMSVMISNENHPSIIGFGAFSSHSAAVKIRK